MVSPYYSVKCLGRFGEVKCGGTSFILAFPDFSGGCPRFRYPFCFSSCFTKGGSDVQVSNGRFILVPLPFKPGRKTFPPISVSPPSPFRLSRLRFGPPIFRPGVLNSPPCPEIPAIPGDSNGITTFRFSTKGKLSPTILNGHQFVNPFAVHFIAFELQVLAITIHSPGRKL